jgi:hypothetical protein
MIEINRARRKKICCKKGIPPRIARRCYDIVLASDMGRCNGAKRCKKEVENWCAQKFGVIPLVMFFYFDDNDYDSVTQYLVGLPNEEAEMMFAMKWL